MSVPEKPSSIRRAFWYFCPAQSSVLIAGTKDEVLSESYPSTTVNNVGHVLYALLWVGAVAAYSVFVIYQHFTTPPKESFIHDLSNGYDPVYVDVKAWCTRPELCGTITITANYSNGPAWCQGLPQHNYVFDKTQTMTDYVRVPVCYTGEHVFSTNNNLPMPSNLGIIVDFSSIDPGSGNVYRFAATGAVEIIPVYSGPEGNADGPPAPYLVNMEVWQVKSVVMGQSIKIKDKVTQSVMPFPIATQYEGRRPSWRATTIIGLAPYADVTTIKTMAGDVSLIGVMSLLGTCCGMAFMMNSLGPWFTDFFVFVTPGPAELDRRKKAKEAKEAAKNGEKMPSAEDGSEMTQTLLEKDAAPVPPPPGHATERESTTSES